MVCIREAIVVEGRYDKNTLSQVVETLILETGGFQIFKDPEQMALLRRAAERRGLIVLTDSDGAGFVIRSRIKGSIPARYLKHAYIPDVYGKERRKRKAGKEGKLGVEGMPPEVIESVLRRAGGCLSGGGCSGKTERPAADQSRSLCRRAVRKARERRETAKPPQKTQSAGAYVRQCPAGGPQRLLQSEGGGRTFEKTLGVHTVHP